MKDDVTKVQISKTDISGKELPGAKLTILDKVGGTAISNPIDIKTTNISKLNSVVLNYKNNMGNTKDFTIMVPVKVTYTWGTVSAKVAIAVDGTIANR